MLGRQSAPGLSVARVQAYTQTSPGSSVEGDASASRDAFSLTATSGAPSQLESVTSTADPMNGTSPTL